MKKRSPSYLEVLILLQITLDKENDMSRIKKKNLKCLT